ncbi:MAG: CesT family type III secretion system chaperone [Pseudomonadota bacterium]
MKTVRETVQALAETFQIGDLALNDAGQAEIVFGGDVSIYITQIDDGTLEFSARLPDINTEDPVVLQSLLRANGAGERVGPGRFAIDDHKDEVIYCERLTAESLSEHRLAEYMTRLVSEVRDLQATFQAEMVKAQATTPAASGAESHEASIIRG